MNFTQDIYDIPIIQEIVIGSGNSGDPVSQGISEILFPRAKVIPVNKGFTTSVTFHVRDENKKIKNVAGLNLTARLYNVDQTVLLIEKRLVNTNMAKGIATLVFTPDDIQNLEPGLYNLYVSQYDTNTNTVLYNNRAYDTNLTVEVKQGGSVTYITQESSVFYPTNEDDVKITEPMEAQASNLMNRDGLATFVVYMTNFTGSIFLEGTLEQHPNSQTKYFSIPLDWAVNDYKYTNFTGLDPHNFVCYSTFIRFRIKTTSGAVDKILFRG